MGKNAKKNVKKNEKEKKSGRRNVRKKRRSKENERDPVPQRGRKQRKKRPKTKRRRLAVVVRIPAKRREIFRSNKLTSLLSGVGSKSSNRRFAMLVLSP